MPIVKKNGEIIYPAVRRGKNMKEETEALIKETENMVQTISEEEQKTPKIYAERLLRNLKKLDDNIHGQNLFDDVTDRGSRRGGRILYVAAAGMDRTCGRGGEQKGGGGDRRVSCGERGGRVILLSKIQH